MSRRGHNKRKQLRKVLEQVEPPERRVKGYDNGPLDPLERNLRIKPPYDPNSTPSLREQEPVVIIPLGPQRNCPSQQPGYAGSHEPGYISVLPPLSIIMAGTYRQGDEERLFGVRLDRNGESIEQLIRKMNGQPEDLNLTIINTSQESFDSEALKSLNHLPDWFEAIKKRYEDLRKSILKWQLQKSRLGQCSIPDYRGQFSGLVASVPRIPPDKYFSVCTFISDEGVYHISKTETLRYGLGTCKPPSHCSGEEVQENRLVYPFRTLEEFVAEGPSTNPEAPERKLFFL